MMRPGSLSLAGNDRLPAYGVAAAGLLVGVLAVLLSRVSMVAFVTLAVVSLALIAFAAVRWPRTVLVLVAISAILPRYRVAGPRPTRYGLAPRITSVRLRLGGASTA